MLVIDEQHMLVTWNDVDLCLTFAEYCIMKKLTQAKRASWLTLYNTFRPMRTGLRNGDVGSATNIRSHIKRIRLKFLDVDSSFNHIQMISGYGYKWIGPDPVIVAAVPQPRAETFTDDKLRHMLKKLESGGCLKRADIAEALKDLLSLRAAERTRRTSFSAMGGMHAGTGVSVLD